MKHLAKQWGHIWYSSDFVNIVLLTSFPAASLTTTWELSGAHAKHSTT